jgi:hypothetical protein
MALPAIARIRPILEPHRSRCAIKETPEIYALLCMGLIYTKREGIINNSKTVGAKRRERAG